MPELPEIEILVRGLRKTVQHQRIKNVTVFDKKTWRIPPRHIKQHLTNQTITKIRRRAKWLIIDLSSNHSLIIHLRMTGQLLFTLARKKDAPKKTTYFLGGHSMSDELKTIYPNAHTRAIIHFTNNTHLIYQDQRKFGYIELLPTKDVAAYFTAKKIAREPINRNYTFEYFNAQLNRRPRTTIKAALLDQTVIAGIGNIYADDALYMAKIKPIRKVRQLTQNERRALYKATRVVLRQAINAGGTSFSDYLQLDGTLGQYWKKRKVYQRTGEPCRRCKTTIKKIRLVGRGTHYCPRCQR